MTYPVRALALALPGHANPDRQPDRRWRPPAPLAAERDRLPARRFSTSGRYNPVLRADGSLIRRERIGAVYAQPPDLLPGPWADRRLAHPRMGTRGAAARRCAARLCRSRVARIRLGQGLPGLPGRVLAVRLARCLREQSAPGAG